MFSCPVCEKKFTRIDNVTRHRYKMHGEEEEDSRGSEVFNITDEDSRESGVSESTDQSSDTYEESVSDELMEKDPWHPIINAAFQTHQEQYEEQVDKITEEGLSNEDARVVAYKDMAPIYRKEISDRYLAKVLWYKSLSRDPIHRKIRDTARRLKDEEEYEDEESWKYAVQKRKFLLDEVLKDYIPAQTENSD